MSKPDRLGGIIHTYQKYDPVQFPSPTAPPPDLVSPAFEHLLYYGSMRRLTEEELARAVHIDPSQIRGLGPSLESLMALLRERKRKILETYETGHVQSEAHNNFHDQAVRDCEANSAPLTGGCHDSLVHIRVHAAVCLRHDLSDPVDFLRARRDGVLAIESVRMSISPAGHGHQD